MKKIIRLDWVANAREENRVSYLNRRKKVQQGFIV